MSHSTDGIVHGRVIELSHDLGFGDGQHVRVTVEAINDPQEWGEGIRRSAGIVADWHELDAIFEAIQQERKIDRAAGAT
jgi:hypothetical protein